MYIKLGEAAPEETGAGGVKAGAAVDVGVELRVAGKGGYGGNLDWGRGRGPEFATGFGDGLKQLPAGLARRDDGCARAASPRARDAC